VEINQWLGYLRIIEETFVNLHRADAVTATTSRRWPENFTPSSRRSYGDNIASMAWGARNLIPHRLKELKREDGTPYVQLLDAGDTKCLPVVTARVNPALNAPYGSVSW
jgi:hypothetical protein